MSIIDGTNFPSRVDLIFFLDAVNPKSYPGSGSTWYDVSPNANNHFTLFNTPTYTQNGTTGTYLTFNGSNQYARSTNAINFNAYSAITLEIGYRSTVTNTTQILYETTGTGGSTATGGITLLMNANGTGTVANSYLSQWQGYGVRAFGYTVSTNSTFNSIIETFVNGVNTTGRQAYVNGTTAQFFTNTAVTVVTSATTAGLVFANTWTYVASRAGTGNFFRGDIVYVRAWGKKLDASDITTNSIGTFTRQPSSYQNSTIATNDPSLIPPGLYQFTSATFTPGGATFKTGPSLAQARTGLTGVGVDDWKNNTSYFNTAAGIQIWTVPATGSYTIDCYGAQGADGIANSIGTGGLGARIRGTFNLTEGELIRLVVGQRGWTQTNGWGGGTGGGGTFAWRPSSTTNPLIAAGGGGCGAFYGDVTASGGQTGTSGGAGGNGGGAGGTGGNASQSSGICGGGGGQGWNGGPSYNCGGAFTWVALYTDPTGFSSGSHDVAGGGFGGGGGSYGGGGGGGGYSGGGSGGWAYSGRGGGGGSYNAGTDPIATAATWSGEGQIIITKL